MYRFLICFSIVCSLFVSCTSWSDDNASHNDDHPYSTSLFVGTDRHETGDGNDLTALLELVTNNNRFTAPKLVFLGGDYVGQGPDKGELGQPSFDVNGVKVDIRRGLGARSRYDVLLTYGSHDKGAENGYSAFFSGPRVCDGYYAYGISYAQMRFPTDSATLAVDTSYVVTDTIVSVIDTIISVIDTIIVLNSYDGLDLSDRYGLSAESAVPHFTAWVESLSDHAPIVIMSHLPMHALRSDNLGAHIWYKAISKAAGSHDILVLFGHNHTLEERGNPADEYCYLLTPGDGIIIQGVDAVYTERLNFSYANAGYIKLGYSSLITFTDIDNDRNYDVMTLRRYSITGVNNDYFGLTGYRNPFSLPLTKSKL
ncbi:MAG: metallophosphoesterase, partial [Bacteroidales bacterium]|nr:metallophosphoesterase [Bacteroidales bacterium]